MIEEVIFPARLAEERPAYQPTVQAQFLGPWREAEAEVASALTTRPDPTIEMFRSALNQCLVSISCDWVVRRRDLESTSVLDVRRRARPLPAPEVSAVIGLLESWIAGVDGEDQQETWDYLKRTLDEDRPSFRKFFP